MRTGLIAEKIGMSRIYDEGVFVPITILQVKDCKIIDHRTEEKNGYNALICGFGKAKEKNVSKSMKEFFKKQNIDSPKKIKEFRITSDNFVEIGKEISVAHFLENQFVDITGFTLGKGFSGVIKRHNFRSLRATHGVSLTHRSHGSTGNRQDPGKVFKGKKMAGRYGNEQVTIQNLKIVRIDEEKGLIMIKGAVPGYKGSLLTIKDSVKKKLPNNVPFPAVIK